MSLKMETLAAENWESQVVSPQTVTAKIKPGMSIFVGTAGAEPRTMVRHLMSVGGKNLEDLELIQLVSFGDAVSLQALQSQKFRLTTFFSGWVADEAIEAGTDRVEDEALRARIVAAFREKYGRFDGFLNVFRGSKPPIMRLDPRD